MSDPLPWVARGWMRRPGQPFYGPVMLLLAATLVVGTCVGQSFLLGQFKEPMQASLGIDGARMAFLYFLATLAGGLSLWPAGVLVDRLGLRRVCLLVLPALALACWGTALAHGTLALLAGLFCLRMLGQGMVELLSGNTVAMWYHRRLGLASTITSVVFAVSLLGLPPVVRASIAGIGWRWTYGVFGLAVLAVWPLAWLTHVDRPERMGQRPDGGPGAPAAGSGRPQPVEAAAADLEGGDLNVRQALATRTFWILTGSLSYYALALTAAVFCVNSIVKERGLPEGQGAWVISALGGAMAISYPVLGPLADRLHARWLQALAVLSLSGALLGLAASTRPLHLVGVGAALGVCISAQATVGATAWVRRYGRDHLGSIRGFVQTTAVASSSIGPFVLESLADGLAAGGGGGSRYTAALWTLAGLGLPVAALAMFLRGAAPSEAGTGPPREDA